MTTPTDLKTILSELEQLDTQRQAGDFRSVNYKEQRWQLLKQICGAGLTIDPEQVGDRVETITDSNGTPFCYVPKGPFVFGPDDSFGDMKAPVYMSRDPVTVRDFEIFLEDSGWDYPREDWVQMHEIAPYSNCPATHLSWLDAKEYCRWLRRRTHEYYSLPHETEWERAARGVDGRLYPWGNDDPTDSSGCFQGAIEYTSTMPVNSFPINLSPYGCTDMIGNVWEWCLDSSAIREGAHILRGGAWCSPMDYSNCVSCTFGFPPDKRVDYAGFRVVYLPDIMHEEYQRAHSPGGARQKSTLTIVGLPPRPGRDRDATAPPDEDDEPTFRLSKDSLG